jgi:hypothetical protein
MLLIGIFAAAALIAGSASTLAVEMTVVAGDACDIDGSADTGANALDADKDKQVANDVNEEGKMHDEQASTDKGNNECGTNEDGAKANQTAGAGTHGDNDDTDGGAATPAEGASSATGSNGNGSNGNNGNQDDGQK